MNTQYIDITWLTSFGLSSDNILDYFYTSPFYDHLTNNEIIRTQGVSPSHLLEMTGMEYVFDPESSKLPHLFVIRKQHRRSRNNTEIKDIYYCLDGILYQAPTFFDLLKTRLAKASLQLLRSYHELHEIDSTDSTDSVDSPDVGVPAS
ncbi:mediator complex, subunit Med6 [Ochromonadaceae sp. CCMP2298]|nr:mediator complex, subunit Med6 [Ochromonadaceae sp. CCMP2298]